MAIQKEIINWFHKEAVLLSELSMVFGPTVGYIPQYIEIMRIENTTGFSPFVCFLMIVSNTLRIVYWFRVQYNFALLLQSLFMIIIMLTIMEEVVYLRIKNGSYTTDHVFFDFNYRYFGNWTSILSYIQLTTSFFLLMSFASFFCGPWGMVAVWTLGDFYKGIFYFLDELPTPFQVSICIALVLDFAIIGQVFLYGDFTTWFLFPFNIKTSSIN